jgi:hypothetical protein
VQQQHTFISNYKTFDGTNHFKLCTSIENSQKERGFTEIAQIITTSLDGKIMVCRNVNTVPAGIKGANNFGICIEHVGNFNKGKDAIY